MPENTVEQLLTEATRRHRAGDLAAAEAAYSQILAIEPTHAPALHLLGVIKASRGELVAAIKFFEAATRSKPDYAEAHYNLGKALQDSGKTSEALEAYDSALQCRPEYAIALNNRGVVLQELNELQSAKASYERAIAAQPIYPEAHFNRATVFEKQLRMDEAISGYRRAIEQKPDYGEALTNLGNVLQKVGQFDEAIDRLLAIDYPTAISLNALGNAFKEVGRLDESLSCYQQAVESGGGPEIASNYLYCAHFHPDWGLHRLRDDHARWNARYAKRFEAAPTVHVRQAGRLRVGFVSPDLRQHPVGRFMLPLSEKLDRSRFEICYFHNTPIWDDVGFQIEKDARYVDEVWHLSDGQLAEQVRSRGIDVLIDLTMHMDGSRLLTFARKPAPLQMTYLAYCSTTGLNAIDYRLSDPHLDPVGMDDAVYSEKTLRLPRTYWCYRPSSEATELVSERRDEIVFGCLNNYCKISDTTWNAWVEILRAALQSKLLIFCPEGRHRETAFGRLKQGGLDPQRLSMISRMPRSQYFQTYRQIDIALDPFPYGGGTTSLDALWAGVPVVSLVGQTAVGRGGASILTNLGKPQWLARNVSEYVRIATELAGERVDRLLLREQLQASPLMDERQFASDFADAIARAWLTQTGEAV